MKILKNGQELVGKTIAFSHVAQFAENITLATECGCVIIIRQKYDEDIDATETYVLHENTAIKHIQNDDYIREKLGELKIFDLDAYNKKRKEEYERKQAQHKEEIEKRERETYERLKLKYDKNKQNKYFGGRHDT